MDQLVATTRGRDACVSWCQSYYIKIKLKIFFIIYEDDHKKEFNPYHRTNLVKMLVLGWVILNPLWSQSLLDFFSTTRVGIKKYSPKAMTSSPLTSSSLMLWEPKNKKGERNRAYIEMVFIGFYMTKGGDLLPLWSRVEMHHPKDIQRCGHLLKVISTLMRWPNPFLKNESHLKRR